MKFFALFALVAVTAAFDQAWEDYKLEFDKHYTPEEEAMRYAKDAGGNQGENSYRYTARQGRCRFNRGQVVATVRGYHDTRAGSENDLTNALARIGPVSVAIDASPSSFRRYRSGVHYAP